MDRLTQRIDIARQALGTLQEIAALPYDKLLRDASIQRFEYSFEALWKAAQAVLRVRYGVELGSPKPVYVLASKMACSTRIRRALPWR